MKPNKEGYWEWFDEKGNKSIYMVVNPYKELAEVHFRVYYRGVITV